MSSWGVLTALSGFAYSGPEMRMGFDPKMNAGDFRTVWTAGSGWGTYSQKAEAGSGMAVTLEAGGGSLVLKELDLTLPAAAAGKTIRSVKTFHSGSPAAASIRKEGDTIRVILTRPVRVEPGKPLALAIAF
jgi:hypothetical protein